MVLAFSFCIYNALNHLYYVGLLENVELIQKHFSDAFIYVYVGNDVPDWYVIELLVRKVILRFTHETGPKNMIHRFLAIDEPEVDIMFVRDADSRIHWKDRWAIRTFLNTRSAKFHIIRDNPQHTTAIMGGLWGMRKMSRVSIRSLYDNYTVKEHGMGLDQNFLLDCVYPLVMNDLLIHSSQTWKFQNAEVLHPFPFTYTNDIYCGRVEGGSYVEPAMTPIDASLVEKPRSSPPKIFTNLLNRL